MTVIPNNWHGGATAFETETSPETKLAEHEAEAQRDMDDCEAANLHCDSKC